MRDLLRPSIVLLCLAAAACGGTRPDEEPAGDDPSRSTAPGAAPVVPASGEAAAEEPAAERSAGDTGHLKVAPTTPLAPPYERRDTNGNSGEPAVPQAGPMPAAIAPFPSGLSGMLVFQSDIEGRPKIFTLDLATGRVRRLTEDPTYRDEGPRWSPDGTRIAFASNRAHYVGPDPEQGPADYDLYVMDADGRNVRRLTTDPANETDATWTPDGGSLIFTSDRDSRGDLYQVWLEDGRVERLTRHFVGRAIMPTVSPDGRRVAFAAQTLRAGAFWHFQVHGLDLASRQTAPITQGGASCWPAWSPDGRAIAYVLLAEEPSALEMMDLQTGERRRLVNDPKLWSYYPDWSPDGRYVAFSVSPAHHEGEDWDLAIMEAASAGRFMRLTTGAGNDRLPDWRPSRVED